MSTKNLHELLSKYDVPAPRYTSYPTVPYWTEAPSTQQWIAHLRQTLQAPEASWSLYLHIPFCESLCTFCGCNTIITKDHKKENPYVERILQEWELYKKQVPELLQRPLKHLHLGGGTPTFLSPAALETLLKPFIQDCQRLPGNFEASIEVDPRRTSTEQLETLFKLGFRRVSMGVQDFDAEVQRLVNRTQPYAITAELTRTARSLGFHSVNFDLIYGLARQTLESFRKTVMQTIELRPDRIALYSFALVPWIKPAQRLFKDEDLPKAMEKRQLYELAREMLLTAGYIEVGMDHFALPTDSLAIALQRQQLHRNFMGYTDHRTEVLLGLGVSSISETPYSFHQNEKVLPIYEESLQKLQIPTLRGHVLTETDRERREQILQLMTLMETRFTQDAQETEAKGFLHEMLQDGLVEIQGGKLRVTEAGKPFLRNACLFFDERLKAKQPQTRIFSQSI